MNTPEPTPIIDASLISREDLNSYSNSGPFVDQLFDALLETCPMLADKGVWMVLVPQEDYAIDWKCMPHYCVPVRLKLEALPVRRIAKEIWRLIEADFRFPPTASVRLVLKKSNLFVSEPVRSQTEISTFLAYVDLFLGVELRWTEGSYGDAA